MLQLDLSGLAENLPFLWDGMRLTLVVTALAGLGGLALGTVVALLRLARNPWISGFAAAYVAGFRAIPLLLVLFWFFFLVPLAIGRPIDGFWSALIGFILFESAYFCEIVRGGIRSIPRGQANAALALGLRLPQVFAHIVLPQAFRAILPVLVTQVIILFQDTSILYIVSLRDFMTSVSIVANRDGRLVEMYLFAALAYLAICVLAAQAARSLLARRAA